MEQQFPVNAAHSQLLKEAEVFETTIEIAGVDGGPSSSSSGVVPAINLDSAIVLMNIFRYACRPRVLGYILKRKNGNLVAAVQAAKFVDQVIQGTSLRGDAPASPPASPMLEFWDKTQVKPEKPMADETVKHFVLEIVLDGSVEKFPVSALNKESMLSLLTHATCEKLPRVAGFNLFDDGGKLVASVPAIAFIGQLADKTGLAKRPADPKAAGWNAVPVVTGTSEEFAEAINKAKREGRSPGGK